MQLTPAFTLQLNNRILPGLAVVGKFDGRHPSLACATSGGKVFLHQPHAQGTEQHDGTSNEVKFLNVNRKITTLCAGKLGADAKSEQLFIGTQTNLLAYDVERNADVFYKEVGDGVNDMIYGLIPGHAAPLILVGGNCSIQGFDEEGQESFWTVTGGNVGAMCFCDVDGDGSNELLVGSDDYEIRSFRGEQMLSEITETDRVTALCPVTGTRFGYALANGTVGLYDRTTRVWRVKSKNMVTSITSFDMDGDGVPELVAGWSNGRVEVRNERGGEVLFKDTLPSSISAVLHADYRLDGQEEIICCSVDGEVRGFLPVEGGAKLVEAKEESGFSDLLQKKQEMLLELKGLEANVKQIKSGDMGAGMIDPNTRVDLTMRVNHADQCIELVVATNNDSVVKSVLVFDFDGGMFEGECLMVNPAAASSTVSVPLRPPRDKPVELTVHAFVGARLNSIQYHVFELKQRLPKFAMFALAQGGGVPEPQSSVSFYVTERVNRFAIWINESFNVENSVQAEQNQLSVSLVSLRDGMPLRLHMTPENGGKIIFQCDNMEVVADLLQDLCTFLQVNELESVADFPVEMETFRAVLARVDDSNAIRLKLTAEMADSSHMVKTMVIKAEDARMRGDMRTMRQIYAELNNINNELIGEYVKRANNHKQLLGALKEVNSMIQKAARLRVGKAKARVVALCREAIKKNNVQALLQIIAQGRA